MAEGTPLAPPVGSIEAKPARSKRGRPAGSKNKAETPVGLEMQEVQVAPSFDEARFDASWGELGTAVKKFLKEVGQ
jgi:hypothetical protein